MAIAIERVVLDPTQPHFDVKLFNRWSFEDHTTYVPHTAGRYSVKRFKKAHCPIVERLTNSQMMHGRNNGKKLMDVHVIKHAMEIIHLLIALNPIQVIVDAVVTIYLLTTEACESAFGNIKTIAEWLANELINAAKGSSNWDLLNSDSIYTLKLLDDLEVILCQCFNFLETRTCITRILLFFFRCRKVLWLRN
ncbi:hypothetical protein UlMin_041480 [Ulmus minor]